MNKDWSEQNKSIQSKLKKASFAGAVRELLDLREKLMAEALSWKDRLQPEDYYAMPFPNANGYHSKTVAYSLWHIARIEDITVHSLIRNMPEVLFTEEYDKKTRSPIITTGNELTGREIADFSKCLDTDALYEYAMAVKSSTDEWLRGLKYEDLKRRFDENDRKRLESLQVVSPHENAAWLMDYWCGKDVAGLIRMPLSRHWIMHIEAAGRIIDKIIAGR